LWIGNLRWATLLNGNIRSQTSYNVDQKFAFHKAIQLIKTIRTSNLRDENRIWTFRHIPSNYATVANTSTIVMSMMGWIFTYTPRNAFLICWNQTVQRNRFQTRKEPECAQNKKRPADLSSTAATEVSDLINNSQIPVLCIKSSGKST